METEKKKYKRIMLKLSGEALANDKAVSYTHLTLPTKA